MSYIKRYKIQTAIDIITVEDFDTLLSYLAGASQLEIGKTFHSQVYQLDLTETCRIS